MISANRIFFTFLLLISLPVHSQNRENDILSYLITDTDTANPINDEKNALDIIISSSQGNPTSVSPLNYIAESSSHRNALDYILAGSANNGVDILNFISGAFSGNGFYKSGTWDNSSNLNRNAYELGGLRTLMPEWRIITSGFGYREWNHRMHKGIDISMAVGDTIRAVMPGVVSRVSFEQKGYGLYIVLKHNNGTETRYAHLSRSYVDEGQQVAYGEILALSGNTGNSSGPHLHFETRVNGVAVNPLDFFNANSDYAYLYIGGSHGTYATASEGGNGLNNKRTYIVRQGDTVKSIAKKTGIRVLRLCQLNFIKDDEKLEVGRMLIIR